ALIADYRRHLDAAPPYVDDPTVRILLRILAEEERDVATLSALLADRGIRPSAHAALLAELEEQRWEMTNDGDQGFQPGYGGEQTLYWPRPRWRANVEHLAYQTPMPPYPQDFEHAMRRVVHDLIFSETEALDIFGHYVYNFHEFPWEFSREAARIAWDEARHV